MKGKKQKILGRLIGFIILLIGGTQLLYASKVNPTAAFNTILGLWLIKGGLRLVVDIHE